MIVIEDRETGAVVAHMCSQKGPGDKWIVKRIGKDLEEMGYGVHESSSSVIKRIP